MPDMNQYNLANAPDLEVPHIPQNESIDHEYDLNSANYREDQILERDVCVVGGGSSGTYTSIRLRDSKKSVVLIERENQLGGHARTYVDPETGSSLNVAVIVFGHCDEVKSFFSRYDVPLIVTPTTIPPIDFVDSQTGKTVTSTEPSTEEIAAAMQRYAHELTKYPEVQLGFDLVYPVAPDLLLPFGEFVAKHQLEALIPLAFRVCQGYSPMLEISTLYMMKYLNADLLNTLAQGWMTTKKSDTEELYRKAAEDLGPDALISTSILRTDRMYHHDGTASSRPVRVLVQTPSGRKLILAKKIVFTIPPRLQNFQGVDLSEEERSLFSRFYANTYCAGVLRNTGLPVGSFIRSYGPGMPYGLPQMPAFYIIMPNGPHTLAQIYYGSPREMSDEEAKVEIIASVQRIQKARQMDVSITPELVEFVNHTPFNMMVSNEAIQAGFYRRLIALQGRRNTFYNGAAFHTQDSSALWQFTERLLPTILDAVAPAPDPELIA